MEFNDFKTLFDAANEKMKRFTSKERLLSMLGGRVLHGEDALLEFVDTTLTKPVSFGLKIVWLAVKSGDHKEVANWLNKLQHPLHETNWEAGVNGAYEHFCFVTPSVHGWVLVLNPNISDISRPDTQVFLQKMSVFFEEVHFYGNHRVSGYGAFGKFLNGEMLRGFSAGDGEVILNFGTLTEVEIEIIEAYRHRNQDDAELLCLLDENGGGSALSDESSVTKIAGAWSVHPETLHEQDMNGLGYIFKDFDPKLILDVVAEKIKALEMAKDVKE